LYARVTRVRTSGQPIEHATIVGEEMERWLRELDGFEGLLLLSRERTTIGVTFWESDEVAERHRATRMQFVERIASVAGVEIEDAADYEVTYANLGAALAGLHAEQPR
jgi:hypothetical protein